MKNSHKELVTRFISVLEQFIRCFETLIDPHTHGAKSTKTRSQESAQLSWKTLLLSLTLEGGGRSRTRNLSYTINNG